MLFFFFQMLNIFVFPIQAHRRRSITSLKYTHLTSCNFWKTIWMMFFIISWTQIIKEFLVLLWLENDERSKVDMQMFIVTLYSKSKAEVNKILKIYIFCLLRNKKYTLLVILQKKMLFPYTKLNILKERVKI